MAILASKYFTGPQEVDGTWHVPSIGPGFVDRVRAAYTELLKRPLFKADMPVKHAVNINENHSTVYVCCRFFHSPFFGKNCALVVSPGMYSVP